MDRLAQPRQAAVALSRTREPEPGLDSHVEAELHRIPVLSNRCRTAGAHFTQGRAQRILQVRAAFEQRRPSHESTCSRSR